AITSSSEISVTLIVHTSSVRSQENCGRVVEDAAGRHEGGLRAVDLVRRLASQLPDRVDEIPEAGRRALGEAAAGRMADRAPVQLQPALLVVPARAEELVRLARTAETCSLDPGDRDVREAVVGIEDVEVVERQVALRPQRPHARPHRELAVAARLLVVVRAE